MTEVTARAGIALHQSVIEVPVASDVLTDGDPIDSPTFAYAEHTSNITSKTLNCPYDDVAGVSSAARSTMQTGHAERISVRVVMHRKTASLRKVARMMNQTS